MIKNSRYQGGVIGWLINHPSRKYKWGQKVVDELFRLEKEGEVSPIVETNQGYYAVRLVASEKSQEKPLSKVEKGIKLSLMQKKQKQVKIDFIESLNDLAQIKINHDVLESVKPLSPKANNGQKKPPSLPGNGGE